MENDKYLKRLMKKMFSFFAAAFFSLLMALPSLAGDFSAAQMKKMSTFLSNFTEVRMYDFTAEKVLDPNHPREMIRFGIWHHCVNNFPRVIKPANSKYGDASIDGTYVKEALKRYFDYDLKSLPSVYRGKEELSDCPQCSFEYYSDGVRYYFNAADGEAVYYAKVTKAKKLPDGNIQMKGYLYNADEPSDILGSFTALAKPHTWKGKPTWAIISLKTLNR